MNGTDFIFASPTTRFPSLQDHITNIQNHKCTMQQNIFIHYAQKSTQLAVCNLFRLQFVDKILISGVFGRATGLLHTNVWNKLIFSITVIFGCILTCGKWCCQFAYPNITWYRRRFWYNLFFRLILMLHNNGVWNLQIIYA